MRQKRIETLLQFLEKDSSDPFLHYALAMEYKGMNDVEKYLEKLWYVYHNFPDYTGNYYHLAGCLAETGNRNQAEIIYQEGIAKCKLLDKNHDLAELQRAYNNFLYED